MSTDSNPLPISKIRKAVRASFDPYGIGPATAAALEPRRASIQDYHRKYLASFVQLVRSSLAAEAWDMNKAFPRPRGGHPLAYYAAMNARTMASLFVLHETGSRPFNAPDICRMRPDAEITEIITEKAVKFADDLLSGYVAKLRMKQAWAMATLEREAQIVAATYEGDLWEDSRMIYTTAEGQVFTWKTNAITNYSCNGKEFNQYPTRLLSPKLPPKKPATK